MLIMDIIMLIDNKGLVELTLNFLLTVVNIHVPGLEDGFT